MKLLIASGNKHKIDEMKKILQNDFDEIISLTDINCDLSPEENGSTFFENAFIKAKEISIATGFPTLSDDSGIVVESLNGDPGIYSARYSNEGTDEANNKKILQNMKNQKNRNAMFISNVVLYISENEIYLGEGEAKGLLIEEAKGTGGFGYDPLFYSFDLNKTFGEATSDEKNAVSHRKRAVTNLLDKYKKKMKI